ncbi:L-aspartate oxidase [Halothece sp. PCC 7418]|uniref:L-aspartate oxidase n=1 Tax=Halothece sp. (strain PCC 7418) TaxID=65093 RepID=UPI0002A062B2|nr:L-aspartate oxidase [Halothece sp. PCC 7418]AFZ43334.1 L-aspartate oxidase [Halothece sp. PCC 7418]
MQFDLIIVGAGAAGLYTALCLPQNLRIAIVSKENLKIGASDWAQGGVAAAIAPGDSTDNHYQDTLKAGVGLCIPEAVRFLVDHAASSIETLVELGVEFDRKGEELAMTLEAAHSYPRVLHAADTTGRAIVNTLTEQVLARENITVIPQAFVLQLEVNPQTQHCEGVRLLHENKIQWVKAPAVILATGGGGQVFAQTTNPTVSTGDGVALAWRVGALLRDIEFFQFHPTALTKPGAPHFLITEAVRGEGAHLVDETGYRFAFEYHPNGELAPRDVVSRAIYNHLHKTSDDPAHATVYLDLRPIPRERIEYRFPNIIKVCQSYGIDVFSQPIPVAPAAHYWMGGVAVDINSATSIPGLYAVGETTNTGVHGANRLASNSLLECLVFGQQFKMMTVQPLTDVPTSETLTWGETNWAEEVNYLQELREALRVLVWDSAGISRTEVELAQGLAQVEAWRETVAELSIAEFLQGETLKSAIEFSDPNAEQQLRCAGETFNLLDVAYLVLKSALFREESRGGHYRSDYPRSRSEWQVHTLIQNDTWWTMGSYQ